MSTVFIHKIRNKTCSPQLKIQPNNARNNLQKIPHGGSDGAAIGATTGDGGVTTGVGGVTTGVDGDTGTGTVFGGNVNGFTVGEIVGPWTSPLTVKTNVPTSKKPLPVTRR